MAETKKLYRSRKQRWIGGVCGGIGNYFDLDPTLIRALFVLFTLIFGSGLLFYIILWIIIPAEPGPSTTAVTPQDEGPSSPEVVEEPETE